MDTSDSSAYRYVIGSSEGMGELTELDTFRILQYAVQELNKRKLLHHFIGSRTLATVENTLDRKIALTQGSQDHPYSSLRLFRIGFKDKYFVTKSPILHLFFVGWDAELYWAHYATYETNAWMEPLTEENAVEVMRSLNEPFLYKDLLNRLYASLRAEAERRLRKADEFKDAADLVSELSERQTHVR